MTRYHFHLNPIGPHRRYWLRSLDTYDTPEDAAAALERALSTIFGEWWERQGDLLPGNTQWIHFRGYPGLHALGTVVADDDAPEDAPARGAGGPA